ncbi:MAG: hypothetical protein HOE53_01000 [Candidatus Magasanikbacteria bacterium]|jgi:hypothetical protein|nr:hypothetical protein [Candidatus Magasanikbacteria bacterium]
MKRTPKKIAFLIGAITGAIIIYTEFFGISNVPSWLIDAIGFPIIIGLLVSRIILWPVCALSQTNICRGLGFDGGPLEWVEWTSIYLHTMVFYGLLFVGIYMVYLKIKKSILS